MDWFQLYVLIGVTILFGDLIIDFVLGRNSMPEGPLNSAAIAAMIMATAIIVFLWPVAICAWVVYRRP